MKEKRNDPQIGQIRQIFQKERQACLSEPDTLVNRIQGDQGDNDNRHS
jgi:hypothetical protein